MHTIQEAIEFDTYTATDTERAFRAWVSANARTLADITITHGNGVEWHRIAPVVATTSLKGLRPEFLNHGAILTGLLARGHRGIVSPVSTLRKEYENALYGFALEVVQGVATA